MADTAVDKADRRGELIGSSLFLTIFPSIFVLARIYTRLFSSRTFGWDDAFILAALVSLSLSEPNVTLSEKN